MQQDADVCTVGCVSHQGASETGSGIDGSSRSAAADPAVTSSIVRQAAARIIPPRIFSRLSGDSWADRSFRADATAPQM